MTIEKKRGCGYRLVGAIYLVGDYISFPCDRMPYLLDVCPVCGHGIKAGRGMTKINPFKLFGDHRPCEDEHRPCFMCDPVDDVAYLMRVGEMFYPKPEHFLNEAMEQGISKRIAHVPKEFKIGVTVVYLAHMKACIVREPVAALQQAEQILENKTPPMLFDTEKQIYAPGIFAAFIPRRIEKLYWQSEFDLLSGRELEDLNRRGITPIPIPDNDIDHKEVKKI